MCQPLCLEVFLHLNFITMPRGKYYLLHLQELAAQGSKVTCPGSLQPKEVVGSGDRAGLPSPCGLFVPSSCRHYENGTTHARPRVGFGRSPPCPKQVRTVFMLLSVPRGKAPAEARAERQEVSIYILIPDLTESSAMTSAFWAILHVHSQALSPTNTDMCTHVLGHRTIPQGTYCMPGPGCVCLTPSM